MKMSAEEIREMTDDQIRERVRELREELFRLRFRRSMMELENPQLPKTIRRDIARMKTILRERELTGERA
jgi:large subunit ribosomal protein L29